MYVLIEKDDQFTIYKPLEFRLEAVKVKLARCIFVTSLEAGSLPSTNERHSSLFNRMKKMSKGINNCSLRHLMLR